MATELSAETIETLRLLGITREQLLSRIIERASDVVLYGDAEIASDSEYDESDVRRVSRDSVYGRLRTLVVETVNARVDAIAAEHVLPKVVEMIETMNLQRTNQWGEKKGESVTFIEYLTQRADAYMREEVDYEGKPKESGNSYSFRPKGTRVAYMIDKHLHYAIDVAMTNALKQMNATVAGGLEGALRVALTNVATSAKVVIETKTK